MATGINANTNLVKIGRVVFELCERTDKRTDGRTDERHARDITPNQLVLIG